MMPLLLQLIFAQLVLQHWKGKPSPGVQERLSWAAGEVVYLHHFLL